MMLTTKKQVVLRHAGDDWSVIEEALRVVSLLNEVKPFGCFVIFYCTAFDIITIVRTPLPERYAPIL